MYIIIALIACMLLALHEFFYTPIARKYDPITVMFYRSIAALIGMSPLLFFVNRNDASIIIPKLPIIALLTFIAMAGHILYLNSTKYMPAGLFSTLSRSGIVFIILISHIFFQDTFGRGEVIGMAIIIAASVGLSLSRNSITSKKINPLGLLSVGGKIIGNICRYVGLGYFAKNVGRALSAFLFEGTAIVYVLIIMLGSYSIRKRHLTKISHQDIKKIFIYYILFVPLTISGIAYATRIGSIAITNAISATIPVRITILAYFFFHEKLTTKQWMYILATVVGIIIIRLAQSF